MLKDQILTKYSNTIIGILILGALGNALWEFVKPFINWMFIGVISILNSVFSVYFESMYIHIAEGATEVFTQPVYITLILLAFATILSYVLFYMRTLRNKIGKRKKKATTSDEEQRISSDDKIDLPKKNNELIRSSIMVLVGIVLLLSIIFDATARVYVYKNINYIERCLDIIEAKTDRQTFLDLRAEYRSIGNKVNYDKFMKEMKVISEQNQIQLPNLEYFK